MRLSQQSSELIIQLTMHFLNYLSDTSNNACNAEGKKTITPGHVAKALKVPNLILINVGAENALVPRQNLGDQYLECRWR
jgi:hypothetical protein